MASKQKPVATVQNPVVNGALYIVDWVNYWKTKGPDTRIRTGPRREDEELQQLYNERDDLIAEHTGLMNESTEIKQVENELKDIYRKIILRSLIIDSRKTHDNPIICIARYANYHYVDSSVNVVRRETRCNMFVQKLDITKLGDKLKGQGWDDFILIECNNVLAHLFSDGGRVLSHDRFRNMQPGITKQAVPTPPRNSSKNKPPNTIESKKIASIYKDISWDPKNKQLKLHNNEGSTESLITSEQFLKHITDVHNKHIQANSKRGKKISKLDDQNIPALRDYIVNFATNTMKKSVQPRRQQKRNRRRNRAGQYKKLPDAAAAQPPTRQQNRAGQYKKSPDAPTSTQGESNAGSPTPAQPPIIQRQAVTQLKLDPLQDKVNRLETRVEQCIRAVLAAESTLQTADPKKYNMEELQKNVYQSNMRLKRFQQELKNAKRQLAKAKRRGNTSSNLYEPMLRF